MSSNLKKKYTQNDLRRLMHEQKASSARKATSSTKIDSPLAKYNDLGQLMCILCKSIVRSEDVWKVHINAKQHKQNVELAKELKVKTHNFTEPAAPVPSLKRPAPPPVNDVPVKQLKGILKNANPTPTINKPIVETITSSTSSTIEGLPSNFFDDPTKSSGSSSYEATLKSTNIKSNLVSIKRSVNTDKEIAAAAVVAITKEETEPQKDDALPEGFFDDPIKDAKARNSEYKNPVEEEWEKFQQAIKEESDFSNAIIAEDQEEAITERQIDEIDEQMHNWNRVLTLEKKKEDFESKLKEIEEMRKRRNQIDRMDISNNDEKSDSTDDDDDNDNEIGDIDEYLDWRSKKAIK